MADADSSTSMPDADAEADAAPDATPDTSADAGLPDASCPPLQATGDEIVDTTTNLTWSRTAQYPLTYADATTACANLSARLPTQSELTAFAATAYAAVVACNGAVPLPWPADGEPMWTTTTDAANPNFFITVHLDGTTASHPKTDGVPFLCVKP
jgi:hypothetical protein